MKASSYSEIKRYSKVMNIGYFVRYFVFKLNFPYVRHYVFLKSPVLVGALSSNTQRKESWREGLIESSKRRTQEKQMI